MKIEVNYRKLASFDDNFASLSRKMDKISDKVNSYARSLDWDVASSDNISNNLAKSTKDLQKQSDSLTNMSRFVTKAAKTYKEMDQAEKQSRLDKIKKAISGFLKKVVSGFENAMGFIGSKFSEYWPKVRDWSIEFFKNNWLVKSLELGAFLIGKVAKNNLIVKFISGDLFNRSFFEKFKIGRFIMSKFDHLDNLIKNSKIVSWFKNPGNFEKLKNSISKLSGKIYNGAKDVLKKFAKGTPFAVLIAIKDISSAIKEILSTPGLSKEEKFKRIMVESLYIGGKAVVVTLVSSVTTVALAPFLTPAGSFGAGFTAGLITEALFTAVAERIKTDLYEDIDTMVNFGKEVVAHKQYIGYLIKGTVIPFTPASIATQVEVARKTVDAIQNHIKPQINETCPTPVESEYLTKQVGKIENVLTNVQSASSFVQGPSQMNQELKIMPVKQVIIDFKIGSYFKTYAQ